MANKFTRDNLKGTTKTQGDFNLGHEFNVQIEGVTVGGFHKVDGVELEFEVTEYQDGEDIYPHYRPSLVKPGKLVLERDWSGTKDFLNWRQSVLDGKVERKSISVIFNDDASAGEAKRINFFNCWPSKWYAPALNARSSGHASEKIEVSFESLSMT